MKLVDPSMLAVRLDGEVISNLTKVVSPLFEVQFPKDNIWGVSEGSSIEAADTYYFFLKPLEKGNHLLDISTMSPPAQITGITPHHAFNVKYEITVK